MIADLQEPADWLLFSTCVARMCELHPVYRFYPGYARRDLESAIQAGRTLLRGRRPGREDQPPHLIDGRITARHRLDLIHNSLSERRPGPSDANVLLFHDVEIEWNTIKEYLRARAAECWPIDRGDDKSPSAQARRQHLTDKRATQFAKNYIEREKNAGRPPTLLGLEAAAKNDGFSGGRGYLRKAFHRIQNEAGIAIRPGRIKKSPP